MTKRKCFPSRPSARRFYWTIISSSLLTCFYLWITNNQQYKKLDVYHTVYSHLRHLQRRDIFTSIKNNGLIQPSKLNHGPLTNLKKSSSLKRLKKKIQNSKRGKTFMKTLTERLNRIDSYCKGYLNETKTIRLKSHMRKQKSNWFHSNNPILKSLSKNKKNGSRVKTIQWCPIYKAASSPWLSLLMKSKLTPKNEQMVRGGKTTLVKLANTLRMIQSHPRVLENVETKRKKIQDGEMIMIVVRHPFERILSAYRDKLERLHGRSYYNKKFSQPIIKKYRGKIETRFKNKERSEKGQRKQTMTGMPTHDTIPTFNEFVHYLLQQNPISMDEHWRPFYVDCNACLGPKFNLILKVETMDRDRDHLLQLLGVAIPAKPKGNTAGGEYAELDATWRKWLNSVNKNKSGVFETSKRYYGELSKINVKKLYGLYEPDFKMFGYSAEKYFKTAW